jgi:hypothetical protein
MSWRLTFLAAVAILAIAGVAIAAQGGTKNVVLCAQKKGGDLRLAAKGRCGKGERKLSIAKQGPRGEQGAPGQQGSPGTTASIQPEPVHLVAPAAIDCEDEPGTFCRSGDTQVWGNYGSVYAPVGFWKDATGEVHLMGTAQGSNGALINDVFVLPAGYRPNATRQFVVPKCFDDFALLQVEPSGNVHLPVVTTEHCVALDGVSFRP